MSRSEPGALPPIRRAITVPWPVEQAFRRFTAELSAWWPLATHSISGPRAVRCGMDGRVGGEIYEEDDAGGRCVWGTILAWEPPGRLSFTWHPGRPAETAQEVEVRFTPVPSGTRLDLVHTGWERYGPEAKKAHRGYGLGWAYVLNHWAGRRRAPVNLVLDAVILVMRGWRRLRGTPG